MKKILLYSCVLFTAIGLAFTFHSKHNASIKASTEGGEDDGAAAWEHQRLADPATGRIPDNIRSLELGFAATLPNDIQDNRSARIGVSQLWQPRGPWNVGGRTRAFAADVTTEAILLAGSASGGMWRSTDSGKSWALTTQLAQQQSVTCLAQDTRSGHTNVWYYGSGEADGASASASGNGGAGGAYYLGNGVYRSTDDGQTWTSLTNTATNKVTYASNWQAVWSIAIDPSRTDSSIVYASLVNGAVFRSNDSGSKWTAVFGGNNSPNGYYTNVIVTPTGVVYVTISSDGSQKGIWRSTDGLNYTNITPAGFPAVYNRIVMASSPTYPNQLYFLANTGAGYGIPDTNFIGKVEWDGLWKYKYLSGNGSGTGGAWFNLSSNLPHTGSAFNKYNCQGSYDMAVSFLPTDTATVFIGGMSIFRSDSGFFDYNHTTQIGGYAVNASLPNISVYPNNHPDQHVLFFSPSNPYIMYNSSDGGLFKTLDDTATNVTWKTFDNGYITTMFYTVTSNHEVPGSSLLLAGAQDNDCLFDNGLSLTNPWTKPIFGDGAFNYIADSGKVFYYETTAGHLFKTQMDTIHGNITAFNRMDPIGGKNYEWLSPYGIDPNNDNIMYFGIGKYLWKNTNLAGIPFANQWDSIRTNWVQWPDSVPNTTSGTITDITALAVSKTPANIVYYGTSNQRVYRIDNANVGTPNPVDITATSGYNSFPSGAYVSCIAVDPDNANNLIVVFSNYGVHNLFYSANGGTTWKKISGNLNGANQPSLRWAAIQHLLSGNTVYWVAASTGLYATGILQDSATVWVQQATNSIGNAVCDMVDVRQSDGLVVVATHTHGVYTANITNLFATVQNINPQYIDMQVELYPNPSSGKASISYYLPEEGNVELRVYNETGMLVQDSQLKNAHQGNNIQSIDIGNQAAGIYFCGLITADKVKTVRMLVVK